MKSVVFLLFLLFFKISMLQQDEDEGVNLIKENKKLEKQIKKLNKEIESITNEKVIIEKVDFYNLGKQ
jgi:hypothetical protein